MTLTAEKSAKEWLEHSTGQSEKWAYKAKCYLMLMTGSPATSGTEGVTMKKCKEKETTVTGYSRFLIENAAGNKVTFAEGSSKGTMKNSESWTVATGLSGANQAITYWALVQESSGEAGKVIAWGSCTSTEIGGTGTPVTVATEKLVLEAG